MNIKLLFLSEENENFEYTGWRHNIFRGPQKDGVLQLGGIRYMHYVSNANCEVTVWDFPPWVFLSNAKC